jgi:hypothetical protein
MYPTSQNSFALYPIWSNRSPIDDSLRNLVTYFIDQFGGLYIIGWWKVYHLFCIFASMTENHLLKRAHCFILSMSMCPSLQRDKNKVNEKIRKQDPGLNDHNYRRAAATRWRRNSSTAPLQQNIILLSKNEIKYLSAHLKCGVVKKIVLWNSNYIILNSLGLFFVTTPHFRCAVNYHFTLS